MKQYHGRKSTITRFKDSASFAITTDAGTTATIDTQGQTLLAARSPDDAVGTLTVLASTAASGTYTAVQVDGEDMVVTLSGTKWNTVPAELSTHRYIRLVGDAAGPIELNRLG